MMKVVRPTSTC